MFKGVLRFLAYWFLLPLTRRHEYGVASGVGYLGYYTLPMVGVLAFIKQSGQLLFRW